MSKNRGGSREELPRVRGQWRPGEATSHPRSRAAAGRRHLAPKARGCDLEEPTRGAVAAQAQEGLEELSHVEGQEGQQ